jgi:flavin-dependent dehydrogenase
LKILVVGGGTAGLVSAMILKNFLDVQVDIVYSKNIGIIGVGEGSTEHWSDFMNFLGIDYKDLIKKCNATFKSGVLFDGWSNTPFLHSVSRLFSDRAAQYNFIYAKQISENKNIYPKLSVDSMIDESFIDSSHPPFNQYHFDTHMLNDFLHLHAKSMGINLYEDNILEINLNEYGYISNLIGNKNEYNYDFYIDCTGFKKLLISKVGGEWKSFSKYLKVNSAITFQTGDEENYNLWTLSKAMDYGWLFRIPVWGRYGNGYIYDRNYLSLDQAKTEVEKLYNKQVEIGKEFKFDPGHIDRPWIKNCVAIGLSSIFVEPLEASSIGTTIQQSFLLMHSLINYDQKIIDKYNKDVLSIMENVRDFIILHYLTDKNNTDFWVECSNIELPDSLNEKLGLWKNRLPIHEDFNSNSSYILFTDQNFIMILNGLGLLNNNIVKDEYYSKPPALRGIADEKIKYVLDYENNCKTFTHKQFLYTVRNRT